MMKIIKIKKTNRYQNTRKVGESTLPWAISIFFLNEKKINIFRLKHIALFMKVIY